MQVIETKLNITAYTCYIYHHPYKLTMCWGYSSSLMNSIKTAGTTLGNKYPFHHAEGMHALTA